MRRSPKDMATSFRRISRRGMILGGTQLVFAGALALRMRYLQVEQADQFQLLADENRIHDEIIPPPRGRIFDREGRVLAENEPVYRITMKRPETEDIGAVIAKLSRLVELDVDDLNKAVEVMERNRNIAMPLAERVTWEEFSRVAANAPALPGVQPEVGLSRVYPRGGDYAHVIGYVRGVSQRDLDRDEDPVLRVPGFQTGKAGIEARLETDLRGKAGVKRVEKNAGGRVMRELPGRREDIPGADVQLTIDAELQAYTQLRLGQESASVVVMDLETGDLKAIVSSPTFDPNMFVRGISSKNYNALLQNDHRPLASKTVQDAYPPGSTFKMVTVLAALDAGLVAPDETVYCPGHMEISGRKFHCWKRVGHGHMNLEQSLRESCDVYYYDLALKVGIENISAMARRLGLGARPDVPMSAVSAGTAPDRAWKSRNRGEDWVIGDTVNAAIGQGFVLTSPLQLAVMTARLATGRSIEPRMVKSVGGIETPHRGGESLGLNENHLRQIRNAMYSACNRRKGTAFASRIVADGMRMAGKTGTAQVVSRITSEEDPWEDRDHALFVNYAPFENPQIAVAVVVEHGVGGAKTAAPIARDVTLQALYKGDPPLEAYPERDRSRIAAQQDRLRREREEALAEASSRA